MFLNDTAVVIVDAKSIDSSTNSSKNVNNVGRFEVRIADIGGHKCFHNGMRGKVLRFFHVTTLFIQ